MNYEQKYKEALARAKEYFKANQKIGELDENDVLSGIFPELKEPEEKMRDWLEKKGEQQQELTPDHWQDVRERAAIAAMQGVLSNPEVTTDNIESDTYRNFLVYRAIQTADVLVKKLKGESI